MRRLRSQRGAALIETAITLPMVLLVAVGIFEFGRAYQTWQVLTNAAREGARVSIIASSTEADVTTAVRNYITAGQIQKAATATVIVDRTVAFGPTSTASKITVNYPFTFSVLGPVVRLVQSSSTVGSGPLTMTAVVTMRNEG